MGRRKTTIYLDPDVLTAVKVLAATRQQSDSDLIEAAVRAYLAGSDLDAARADLRALMDRVADRSDLDDERAMALAVDEVHDVRVSRRGRRSA